MRYAALLVAAALLLPVGAVWAQDDDDTETIEEAASEDEVQAVADSIGRINCTAPMVEKENDDLFEIDDADCGELGQFDIKLDGDYNIISMTRD